MSTDLCHQATLALPFEQHSGLDQPWQRATGQEGLAAAQAMTMSTDHSHIPPWPDFVQAKPPTEEAQPCACAKRETLEEQGS